MLVRDRARGIDPRPLEVSTERISISSEETFERDIGDVEQLHDELRRMAARPRHLPRAARADRAHRDDQAPLSGLRDPHPLDVARRRHRRRRADRRARVRPARPRAPRPARPAPAGRASVSPGSRITRSSSSSSDRVARDGGVRLRSEESASASPRPTRRASRTTRTTWCGSRWRASSSSSSSRAATSGCATRGSSRSSLESHVRYLAPAVFDDRLLDPHPLPRPARGAVQVRVRDRARRHADRRRLDGARDGRRDDAPADAHARVAARRYRSGVARRGRRRRRSRGRRRGLLRLRLRLRLRADEEDLRARAVVRVPGRVRHQLPVGRVDDAARPRSSTRTRRNPATTLEPGASDGSSLRCTGGGDDLLQRGRVRHDATVLRSAVERDDERRRARRRCGAGSSDRCR